MIGNSVRCCFRAAAALETKAPWKYIAPKTSKHVRNQNKTCIDEAGSTNPSNALFALDRSGTLSCRSICERKSEPFCLSSNELASARRAPRLLPSASTLLMAALGLGKLSFFNRAGGYHDWSSNTSVPLPSPLAPPPEADEIGHTYSQAPEATSSSRRQPPRRISTRARRRASQPLTTA